MIANTHRGKTDPAVAASGRVHALECIFRSGDRPRSDSQVAERSRSPGRRSCFRSSVGAPSLALPGRASRSRIPPPRPLSRHEPDQLLESPERAVVRRVAAGTDGHASISPRRSRAAGPVPELSLPTAPPAEAVPLTAVDTGTTSRARPRRPSSPPSVEASSGAGAKLDWRTAACGQF